MIFLFAYFWTTVQFQPKDMAKNLRDRGSFIPGLRPGHRTAEYLETVMIRITFFGAAFLGDYCGCSELGDTVDGCTVCGCILFGRNGFADCCECFAGFGSADRGELDYA